MTSVCGSGRSVSVTLLKKVQQKSQMAVFMRLISHQLVDMLVPLNLLLHLLFVNILTSFYKRHLYTKH